MSGARLDDAPTATQPLGGVQQGLGAFTVEQAARVTRAAAEAPGITPHAGAFADICDGRLVEAASRLAGIDLRTAPLAGRADVGLAGVSSRPWRKGVGAGLLGCSHGERGDPGHRDA